MRCIAGPSVTRRPLRSDRFKSRGREAGGRASGRGGRSGGRAHGGQRPGEYDLVHVTPVPKAQKTYDRIFRVPDVLAVLLGEVLAPGSMLRRWSMTLRCRKETFEGTEHAMGLGREAHHVCKSTWSAVHRWISQPRRSRCSQRFVQNSLGLAFGKQNGLKSSHLEPVVRLEL